MPNKLTDAELQKIIPLIRETQWHYKLDQYSTASLVEINKSINQARREIGQKLKTINPESKFTKDRLNDLAIEMQDMTVAVQSQITGQIENVAIEAGLRAYPQHADIMSFGGLVPNFNNVALTGVQLKAIVNTPVGGKLLNEWVDTAFTANLKDTFKQEITTGLLKGESYKNLVKRFDNKAFSGLENDIEGLTRTYVQSINVKAMDDTLRANADIIKGWRWNSVYENRSCIRCISLDAKGETYPIGGGPEIPLHVNCRCFPEPITKTFRELGVDIDDIKDSYRPYTIRGKIDPITGKVIPGKIGVGGGRIIDTGRFLGTYEDFFKSLPENVQLQMLGPTRLGLYKSGKLSLAGLTDAAGNTKLLTELGVVRKGGKYVAAQKVIPTIAEIEKIVQKEYNSTAWKAYDKKIAEAYKDQKKWEAEHWAFNEKIMKEGYTDANLKRQEEIFNNMIKSQKIVDKANKAQKASLDKAIKKAVYPKPTSPVKIVPIQKGKMDWSKEKLIYSPDKKAQAVVNKGIKDLEEMFHSDVISAMPEVSVGYKKGVRASYDDALKRINAGSQDIGTLIHEYGHAVEFNYPGAKDAANAFRTKRVGNESLTQIYIGKDEMGWKDEFFNHYCGKYYPNRVTEIISMGVQQMYKNPSVFFKQDLEYFNFIVKVMWGQL